MIWAWLRRRIDRRRRRVLSALLNGDRTGADIMRWTGLGSGSVYPVLIVAEERGAVTSRWGYPAYEGGPRPVIYTLTDVGRREIGQVTR